MPPRKKKTVKTPQKIKSSSPSSPAATIDPTTTPPKPLPATDSATFNFPSTENDHQPKPKIETELKTKPEIETELKAKPEIDTEFKAKPSPELETNTVSPEASKPASEEAPEAPEAPEAAEALEVKPSEISSAEPTEKPAKKTVLRVRKVVKKKIVKKLVPKGSLAAKKLSSVPQQDALMSLPESSEKYLNPKGSLAGKKVSAMSQQGAVMSLPESSEKDLNPKGSLAAKKMAAVPQQDAVMSLPESSEKDLNPNSVLDSIVQQNATEEVLNPNAFQQPEPVSTVLEAENSVGIKEECPQIDAKDDILKTRKVVRKKIVKKLVPKGSLAAKKVDAVPLQDGIVSLAAKKVDTVPLQDGIVSLAAKKVDAVPLQDGIVSLGENTEKVFNPKPSLGSTFQQDAPEKTFNHDANQQPEVKMEEDKKLESGKFKDNVEIKEECGEMEAKSDNLESGKEGDGFEAAEGKDHEALGLSERMKRRKAEIFIGGLDRDAKEEDIRSVFGKVGEILELRMMMDGQTGKNKGYAFLRYLEPSQAKRAVTEFAKVEIRGKTCGAAAVQGNDTIFLGNIDKQWKKEDVLKLLKENGIENIDTITVVMDPNNTDSNRGFAFVELETNKDAQRAYKKLQKKDVFGKGRNIKVAWADSFNIPDEEDMLKVKSVYAEGVPNSWDEDRLKETFEKFGEIDRIVLGRNIKSAKRRDIAFINYKTREAALSCIESFSSDELTDNGSKVNLKVALAKRVQKANQNKGQKSTINNPLKDTFKPAQGLPSQDYTPAIAGTKRTFSALGDGGMYSDLRGYPRTRLDSSFGIAGSSYSMIPHGGVGSSLHYQHQSVPSGYSTVAYSGSGNNTDAYQVRQGVPPYSSNLYHRYQK